MEKATVSSASFDNLLFPDLFMTFRKESPGTPDSGACVKQVLPEGEKGPKFRDTKSH